jgi:hypothetical protein
VGILQHLRFFKKHESALRIQLVLEGSLQDVADEKQRQNLVDTIAKLLNIEKQSVRILHVTPAS